MMQTTQSSDDFFALRNRAYELADTGRFEVWGQVAGALRAEGFVDAVIDRFGGDRLAVMMIGRSCTLARSRELEARLRSAGGF